jgi:fatty acid elongase 3
MSSTISFSAERPFGVYLFDCFDKAYTSVVGSSATEFTFIQGYTPLSTVPEGLYAILQ